MYQSLAPTEPEQTETGASGSFEVEDEFHRPDDDFANNNGDKKDANESNTDTVSDVKPADNADTETPMETEEYDDKPLELTKKSEPKPSEELSTPAVPAEERVTEVGISTEQTEIKEEVVANDEESPVNTTEHPLPELQPVDTSVSNDDNLHTGSVIQPVPSHLPNHHDHEQPVNNVEENVDVLTTDNPVVTTIDYNAAHGVNHVVYQDDGSYIEYAYQDGTKNIGEAAVQVEYIGSADVTNLGDGNVEYVTLAGDITTEEGEESRVIGVLRDGALSDYNNLQNVPYYTIRTSEDPIQAVIDGKIKLHHCN